MINHWTNQPYITPNKWTYDRFQLPYDLFIQFFVVKESELLQRDINFVSIT